MWRSLVLVRSVWLPRDCSLSAASKVSIYTKDLPPNTTSNIAGGQWFPFTVYDVDCLTPEFEKQYWAATEFAYKRYQTMVGDYYGVRWLPNFQMSDSPLPTNGLFTRTGPLLPMLPDFTELLPGRHPFPFRYARRFNTMFIQPPIYLDAMLREIRLAGVPVEIREFSDPKELQSLPQPVIVNCTGLGAKALFGDEELIPDQRAAHDFAARGRRNIRHFAARTLYVSAPRWNHPGWQP